MVLQNFDAKQYLANYADLQKAFDTDKAKQRRSDFVAGKEGATFDAKQYLANYVDLQKAFGTEGETALNRAREHYKIHGAKEGRRDTDVYGQARQHFLDYGMKEGRVDTDKGGTLSPEATAERLAKFNKRQEDFDTKLASINPSSPLC